MKLNITTDLTSILPLLTHDIYRRPEAFVRELVSNSLDACLRANPPTSPLIRLEAPATGVVECHDDGIGMDRESLQHRLLRLGRQDPPARGDTIGRFGIGFKSVFAVATLVEVESMASYGASESLRLVWSGGKCATLTPGRRTSPGTSVRVHLRPELATLGEPGRLRRVVRSELPFLPAQVRVCGRDPRPEAPWRNPARHLSSGDLADLREWLGPSCHALRQRIGPADILISFPRSANAGRWQFFERGVTIGALLDDLVPANWKWLEVLVDAPRLSTTLGRSELIADDATQALLAEVCTTASRELCEMARVSPDSIAAIARYQREGLLDAIRSTWPTLVDVAACLQVSTTLGTMQLQHAASRRASSEPSRPVTVLLGPPQADGRWAAARARDELVINASNRAEAAVISAYVDHTGCLGVDSLSWEGGSIISIDDRTLEDPRLDRLMTELSGPLAEVGLLIEPANFPGCSHPSIAETGLMEDDGTAALDPGQGLLGAIGRVRRKLKGGPSPERGRLLLNLAHPFVRQIADREARRVSVDVLAALLLATGLASSGTAITERWSSRMSLLLERAIRSVTSSGYEGSTKQHIRLFFAHSFSSGKTLLRHLRAALEHAPFFWEVISADEETARPRLFDNVKTLILDADVVLAELSEPNSNVYAEVGLTLGLGGRPVGLLLDPNAGELPSGFAGFLAYHYDRGDLTSDIRSARGQRFCSDVQSWVLSNAPLAQLRGSEPYYGYRLLTEQGLATRREVSQLKARLGSARTLLEHTAAAIAVETGISRARLDRMRAFFLARAQSF